ncbi:MAG TPA: hypothetical protein VEL06_00005 [Haliangiales bacterium]|nr:hypothetical protein [Haliangiales bacterium]
MHHIELNLRDINQLFNTMDPSPFHETYLYEWWPLRRRGQIFDKLSRMPVEVRKRA